MKIKRFFEQYRTYTLITIIVLLILIVITIGLFISNQTNNNETSEQSSQSTVDETKTMQEIEVNNDISNTVYTYISDNYPTATDITNAVEFIGLDYGIVNVSMNVEGNKNIKLYLNHIDDTWNVFHESSDTITCEKLQELISTETILSSFCEG